MVAPETLTESDVTGPEKAAWEVATRSGFRLDRAGLRALLDAADLYEPCPVCEAGELKAACND